MAGFRERSAANRHSALTFSVGKRASMSASAAKLIPNSANMPATSSFCEASASTTPAIQAAEVVCPIIRPPSGASHR
jgi:hypothetical protein